MSHTLFEPMAPGIEENPDYQVLLTSFNALRASYAKIHVENVHLRKQLAILSKDQPAGSNYPLVAPISVKKDSQLKQSYVPRYLETEPISSHVASQGEERGDHDITIVGPDPLPIIQPKSSKKSCNQCDKSFSRTSDLKRHVLSYHEGRKFPCSQCGQIYSRKATMLEHLRSVHRGAEHNPEQPVAS